MTPSWLTKEVLGLARHIAASYEWDLLPVLADALEDARWCDTNDKDWLHHLRKRQDHDHRFLGKCNTVETILETAKKYGIVNETNLDD